MNNTKFILFGVVLAFMVGMLVGLSNTLKDTKAKVIEMEEKVDGMNQKLDTIERQLKNMNQLTPLDEIHGKLNLAIALIREDNRKQLVYPPLNSEKNLYNPY